MESVGWQLLPTASHWEGGLTKPIIVVIIDNMIGKLLKDLIRKHGLTYREIARDLGVDHGNLSRSLRDDKNPSWTTIKMILEYLGYDFKIVKRKGVNPRKPKPFNLKQKGGKFARKGREERGERTKKEGNKTQGSFQVR